MHWLKSQLQKVVPQVVFRWYHRCLSFLAAVWYRHPSKELIVIGITGTNGKSSVVKFLSSILTHSGEKVGSTSTVEFSVAGKTRLNDLKMTMPGRFSLQRMLREMADAGCRYAVIESSSEGVLQSRHTDILYDAMVFTNLAPEHLERHGGFAAYKEAKLSYFSHLAHLPPKYVAGKRVPKSIIVNGDDPAAQDFLGYAVEKKYAFSLQKQQGRKSDPQFVCAQNIQISPSGSRFTVDSTDFELFLPGRFNIENALAAIAAGASQGVKLPDCSEALKGVRGIPGRMERIDKGQPFQVVIDYAPEPNALARAYEALEGVPHRRLIHVLGSTGGGRDRSRRSVLGRMSAAVADVIYVTNEDPYDDDPQSIIDDVAAGAVKGGKVAGTNLFKIADRRQAIREALALAEAGDLVLITGKGAEQAMAVAGGRLIPWDDRQVAAEELANLGQ